MRAIILAAGRGRRMQELTADKPKCLLELKGKKLLEWQLESLRGAGIEEIAIVTGYKREKLKKYNLHEFCNKHWANTQMVSSLACADEWLQHSPCIVSYSDIFYDATAVTVLIEITADIAVTYDPTWRNLWSQRFDDPLIDAETFKLSENGTIAEIGRKPRHIGEIEGQYMGLLRLSPEGWDEMQRIRKNMSQESRDGVHMTHLLQLVIEAGRKSVFALPYRLKWGEIDHPHDLNIT